MARPVSQHAMKESADGRDFVPSLLSWPRHADYYISFFSADANDDEGVSRYQRRRPLASPDDGIIFGAKVTEAFSPILPR